MTHIRFSLFACLSDLTAVAPEFSGVRGSHTITADCGVTRGPL